MNEEQAVLDFFAREENLPLGLAVAEQIDELRQQMNNRYWQKLHQRLSALIANQTLPWRISLTEDKNAQDALLGLHLTPHTEQPLYLRPMIEQQYLGGEWRIYFGLMWSGTPSPDHLGMTAVRELKESLQQACYKNNASFLAWQWTKFHPRRRDFLLRYAREPEKLLGETESLLKTLLIDHSDSISLANSALRSAPRSTAISLDQLRSKRGSE